MSPGKLNKRIQIVEEGQIPNGSGGFTEGVTVLKTSWAMIKPIFGKEFYQAQQTQAAVTHKFTIRYWPDLKRSYCISYQGKMYEIQYIIEISESGKFQELHVLERG